MPYIYFCIIPYFIDEVVDFCKHASIARYYVEDGLRNVRVLCFYNRSSSPFIKYVRKIEYVREMVILPRVSTAPVCGADDSNKTVRHR